MRYRQMGGMNDVAPGGLEQRVAAIEPAEPARSVASSLLAPAEIWSRGRTRQSSVQTTEAVPRLETATIISDSAATAPAGVTTAPRSDISVESRPSPPRRLSLALQGGGTFAAFTWGVLERLLEEPDLSIDSVSGASAGAVNAALLASGLAEGGRERARSRLDRFWQHVIQEASFRSLMLLGAFSPAGSSVAFGPTLRSGHFDPFDLDPLRRALARHINFDALRKPTCPKVLLAATRIRDGSQHIFTNENITADAVLASTCPPQIHCAVEIDGEAYWDGGYGANPPLVRLVRESAAGDLLVVQVTPSRDSYVPITLAAIDRRLDQITANSALNAELAALEWARHTMAPSLRI